MTAEELELVNRERVVARILPAGMHDVRNQLQGISGTIELLAGPAAASRLEERVQAALRRVADLGDRLDRVSRLLSVGPVKIERLHLARACDHVTSLRRASWTRRRLRARIEVGDDVCVRADLGILTRVLLNLLLNAEASLGGEPGEVTLRGEAASGAVRLSVTDSGPGVATDRVADLFTTAGPHGRLATGLVVSRRLAESTGATLEWAGPSAPSCFVLTLPAGQASA